MHIHMIGPARANLKLNINPYRTGVRIIVRYVISRLDACLFTFVRSGSDFGTGTGMLISNKRTVAVQADLMIDHVTQISICSRRVLSG